MLTTKVPRIPPVYFGLFALVSCWLTLAVPDSQGNSDRLKELKLSGIKMADSPYHFEPHNLFEYINGAADFYIAYGFASLVGANYFVGSNPNDSITVDIYDMGKKINAFGLFQSKWNTEASSLNIGAASFGDHGYLVFYKDRYFVEINAFIKNEKGKAQPMIVAQTLAENIPGDNSPPFELSYFPEHGRVKRSEKYIKGGILGHAFLDRGIVCDYLLDEDTVSAFLSFFPSKNAAKTSFEQYRKYLQKHGKCLPLDDFGGNGLISQEPYHKQILIAQKDTFIIGVYDLPKAEKGKRIMNDMVERIDRSCSRLKTD